MATRALIGYLDTDNLTLTSTYNHYDGYPENLGKALENFFNSHTLAKDIANYGYVSYINDETGEIEANHKQAPTVTKLPDNFNEAMGKIAEEIDSFGGDYGYVWDDENGEWIVVKNDGIRSMTQDLEMQLAHLKDKFSMLPDQPDQTMEAYHVGDHKEVVTNESKDIKGHVMMLLDKLESKLGRGEKDNFKTYQESVMRDIKAGGPRLGQYEEFDIDAMEEDYKNYIADKMDLDEAFIHQMKYRAGIIK